MDSLLNHSMLTINPTMLTKHQYDRQPPLTRVRHWVANGGDASGLFNRSSNFFVRSAKPVRQGVRIRRPIIQQTCPWEGRPEAGTRKGRPEQSRSPNISGDTRRKACPLDRIAHDNTTEDEYICRAARPPSRPTSKPFTDIAILAYLAEFV